MTQAHGFSKVVHIRNGQTLKNWDWGKYTRQAYFEKHSVVLFLSSISGKNNIQKTQSKEI